MKAHTRAYGPQNTPLNITQYPFFSVAHGAFSKREHILRDETSLTKYQTTEINPITLSYHDGIKLETNSEGIDRKHTYLHGKIRYWTISGLLKKMKEGKVFRIERKWKYNTLELLGCSGGKRGLYPQFFTLKKNQRNSKQIIEWVTLSQDLRKARTCQFLNLQIEKNKGWNLWNGNEKGNYFTNQRNTLKRGTGKQAC